MSIAEEKREYIKKCLPLALDPANKSETQRKRYELLLRDSAEGKLYKYRTFDSNGYALNSLITKTLHCSHPHTFNDPFDMKIGCKSKSLFDKKTADLINMAIDAACVGCLTTDPADRLMWSHYADDHKGFCIEYDFNSLKKYFVPYPVVYSETRPLLDDFYPVTKETIRKHTMISILTKDKKWEYENEWRVIKVPDDFTVISAVDPIDLTIPITAVYLGANISPGNKAIILEIAKKRKISVKEMTLDNEAYKLNIKEI